VEKATLKGLRLLALFAVVALSVLLFRAFVLERCVVDGASMEDTLFDGDVVLIDKTADEFFRYDVVVARVEAMAQNSFLSETNIVKRIIGLPTETIEIQGGAIYIDGVEQQGYDDCPPWVNARTSWGGIAAQEGGVTLGEDEYFLLGDNRQESMDSRFLGAVKGEDIRGSAVFQIYPPSRIGTGFARE